MAEQRFAEPIAREEDVLAVTGRLARRLQPMLERRGEGARTLELTLFRTDGAVRRLAVATSRPLRDPQAIVALFVERLASLADALDPGFGFDLARLSVIAAEPCPPEQVGLGEEADDAEVDRLVDRLSARLGSPRVRRLIAADSHVPELAGGFVPAQALAATAAGWTEFRAFRRALDLDERPPRLLIRPEPIEAIAQVPDGPPIRFRWRRVLHAVRKAEGPERIAPEWWRMADDTLTRDYFRVEDEAGRRFWLYREGLWGRETATPRWFMHGLFG